MLYYEVRTGIKKRHEIDTKKRPAHNKITYDAFKIVRFVMFSFSLFDIVLWSLGKTFFFLFLCALFFHFYLVFHSKYSRRERKIGFVYIINTVCTLAQIERYNNMKKKIRVSLYAYFPSLPI